MNTDTIEHSESTKTLSSISVTQSFEKYQTLIDQTTDVDSLSRLVLGEFVDRTNHYISAGNEEYEKVQDRPVQDPLLISESYLLHYRLSEYFKSILLLHRDVLLQLNIAKNKRLENQIAQEEVLRHFNESRGVLSQAVASFIKFSLDERRIIKEDGKKSLRSIERIKHQQNPWEVYQLQFAAILNQIAEIDKSSAVLIKVINSFKEIKDHIYLLNRDVNQKFESTRKLIREGTAKLENVKEVKDLNPLILWIDRILDDREPNIDQQQNFAVPIENKTKSLGKLDIPIATQEGLILKRKIELNKVTNKWLEYVLLPLLVEIWDSEDSMVSYLDHSLINLKSGLMLAKNNKTIDSVSSQIQLLRNIEATVEENIEKQNEASQKIEKLVNESLIATDLYDEEDFLEVSLQSSFAQYTAVRNNLFIRIKDKLKNLFTDLGSKYEEANLSTNQKRLEASIECINYRMYKESNSSYDSIFRNKIFIGDLFLVARKDEEKMLVQSLRQWKAGFHQSSLIVGNHLSGKTTFMEYVAKKHFGREIIKLEVTGTISVEGRKFQASYDLNEALNFIKNNLYHSHPLIIIDNLEIWRNEEHQLLDNVRAVIKYMESESDNAYVMVATSKAMQEHLDTRISFTNSFSTIINLNKSTSEEIHEAVVLRHGASHKDLITADEQKLSPKQIERKVKELGKSLNYNMGKVLQAWTYSSTVVSDKLVLFEEKDYIFRDFFTSEELIVLKYVVLYKHINEVVLKHFLGRRNAMYFSGLKRLVNTKVLIRNEDGDLHLNTVINHDVIDILKYRGIL